MRSRALLLAVNWAPQKTARQGSNTAAAAQFALAYTEPPYWYYPIRQSLAAALLQAGRYTEAERQFQRALSRAANQPLAIGATLGTLVIEPPVNVYEGPADLNCEKTLDASIRSKISGYGFDQFSRPAGDAVASAIANRSW